MEKEEKDMLRGNVNQINKSPCIKRGEEKRGGDRKRVKGRGIEHSGKTVKEPLRFYAKQRLRVIIQYYEREN